MFEITLVVAATVATLIIVIYLHFKRCTNYWKKNGVYAPTATFPFGNARSVIFQKDGLGSEFNKVYKDIKSKGKSYGGYYFFTRKIFVPTDIELIKECLSSDNFQDHIFHSDPESDPLSVHLPSLKGDKWKAMRSKLSPAFSTSKIRMMLSNMMISVQDFYDVADEIIAAGESLRVKETISHYTMDTVVSCAFGVESHILKNKNSVFKECATKFFDTSLRHSAVRLLTFIYPDLLTFFKVKSIREDMATLIIKVMTDVINHRLDNDLIRYDFVHLLLQIQNNIDTDINQFGPIKNQKHNETFSLSTVEIIANCLMFFIGGYETSSSLITFCLYELALQQDIQKKAREDVLKQGSGDLSYDALQSMEYLNRCIKETLRKYPSIPALPRECTKPFPVPESNLVIEKGTAIFISIYGVHHDPNNFPNPEKFDPDRFLKPTKSGTFIPFGGGSRMCIAFQFGLMQARLIVASILKKYEFTVDPKTKLPVTFNTKTFVLVNENEIFLNFTKLNN